MVQIIPKDNQGYGEFNGGQIVENKPIGFPQDGGEMRSYSNLFYWAHAKAESESTIGLHPHKGFEIVTFVLEGTIRHYDTKQNKWIPLQKGDVQIIRAGNGIEHSEHLHDESSIFQIWFDPDLNITLSQPASYNDYRNSAFPEVRENGVLKTIYAGPSSPFEMNTIGVKIEKWRTGTEEISQEVQKDKYYSIYVMEGSGNINGNEFSKDDFIVISEEESVKIAPSGPSILFMIESPKKPGYKTYAEIMRERFAHQ